MDPLFRIFSVHTYNTGISTGTGTPTNTNKGIIHEPTVVRSAFGKVIRLVCLFVCLFVLGSMVQGTTYSIITATPSHTRQLSSSPEAASPSTF